MFNMTCNTVSIPLGTNVKLFGNHQQDDTSDMKKYPYQELIDSLLFAAQGTRPDISFVVNLLSRFNNCFQLKH